MTGHGVNSLPTARYRASYLDRWLAKHPKGDRFPGVSFCVFFFVGLGGVKGGRIYISSG